MIPVGSFAKIKCPVGASVSQANKGIKFWRRLYQEGPNQLWTVIKVCPYGKYVVIRHSHKSVGWTKVPVNYITVISPLEALAQVIE